MRYLTNKMSLNCVNVLYLFQLIQFLYSCQNYNLARAALTRCVCFITGFRIKSRLREDKELFRCKGDMVLL